METDFQTIYESLLPELTLLEKKRVELKAKGKRKGLIAGSINFFICEIAMLILHAGWFGCLISVIVGYSIYRGYIVDESDRLLTDYKSIISTMISKICNESVYVPDEGVSRQRFMSSGLFDTYPDHYRAEDFIAGKIDKTAFICSEVTAKEKYYTYSKRGREEKFREIFQGFLFIADFQKNFKGHTIVSYNFPLRLWSSSNRVKLEDPEFERHFDVYSSNQVEARYLLSPDMMERLVALRQKFPGGITVSFSYSVITIAIPDYTNHFEPNIFTSMLSYNSLKKEFDTLLSIFQIVDELNLNVRIWTKE